MTEFSWYIRPSLKKKKKQVDGSKMDVDVINLLESRFLGMNLTAS